MAKNTHLNNKKIKIKNFTDNVTEKLYYHYLPSFKFQNNTWSSYFLPSTSVKVVKGSLKKTLISLLKINK